MPARHPSSRSPATPVPATLVARSLTLDRGGHSVLSGVSLTVGPGSHIGVIGPNGVGKSSLLQVLAGVLVPDGGEVTMDPPSGTVGYLVQEHESPVGVTVKTLLARRTGSHDAEAELTDAARALARGNPGAADRYQLALERFTSLGGG